MPRFWDLREISTGLVFAGLSGCTFGGDAVGTLGGADGLGTAGPSTETTATSLPATSPTASDGALTDSADNGSTDTSGNPVTSDSDSTVGATTGGDLNTSDDGSSARCGNNRREAGEDCDDANADESDGCLSTCTIPRSCLHIAQELADAGDGTYGIISDQDTLKVYCDMTTHGGGWTLVAKVNIADQDTPAESEPVGWLNMVLADDALASPAMVNNGPLESHGAFRFSALLGPQSLARFELVAQTDEAVTLDWYKRVASPQSFEAWFGNDDTNSEVCLDVGMTSGCSNGTINGTVGYCPLVGMSMVDYGYVAASWVHMRLEPGGDNKSGVCSDTLNNQGNAWPDSYQQHWGNGLRIWLRE